MAVVYVIQKQMRYDDRRRGLVSRFDLEPAKQYGELVFLLSSTAEPFSPEPVLEALRERLAPIKPGDYLLLVGNPCLIGWATAIAADLTEGQVNLLQWHGKERRYIEVKANIFGELDKGLPDDRAQRA